MKKSEQKQSGRVRLENALLEELTATSYGDITVAHLIGKAGVTRKTFYLYFSNKEDCLKSLTRKVIQAVALSTAQFTTDKVSTLQSYQAEFRFWLDYSGFLASIKKNNLDYIFLQELTEHIRSEENEFFSGLCLPVGGADEDCLQFFVAGYCYLLLGWAARNFDTSADEMGKKFERLLHLPLFLSE